MFFNWDLFNASFVSCWTAITDPTDREDLVANLRTALVQCRDLPEITQIILNLAEFMQHCAEKVCVSVWLYV